MNVAGNQMWFYLKQNKTTTVYLEDFFSLTSETGWVLVTCKTGEESYLGATVFNFCDTVVVVL